MAKTLIVLLGPTGVGKTDLSIHIAQKFQTEIISCDSRQIFKEMKIGTAVPGEAELSAVPHHFIATHSIEEYYSAARFEMDVIGLLDELFVKHDVVLMAGGSMLYIDAVCKGIDDIPDVDAVLREELLSRFASEGLEVLRRELRLLDPDYYNEVDLQNPKRILHALEICYQTGRPYSSFRSNQAKARPFNIVKIGLNRDRSELYNRINQRVDEMFLQGLEDEARKLYPFREYNSLNTVGYRELFDYFDSKCSLEEAKEKIKANSRKYARKQLTWFRRDTDIAWFHPDEIERINNYLFNAVTQK